MHPGVGGGAAQRHVVTESFSERVFGGSLKLMLAYLVERYELKPEVQELVLK